MVNLSQWQFGRHENSAVTPTPVTDRQMTPGYSVQYDVMTAERMRYNNAIYKAYDYIDNRSNIVTSQDKSSPRSDLGTCQRSGRNDNVACYCMKTPYCGLLNSYARETEKSFGSSPVLTSVCKKHGGQQHPAKADTNGILLFLFIVVFFVPWRYVGKDRENVVLNRHNRHCYFIVFVLFLEHVRERIPLTSLLN